MCEEKNMELVFQENLEDMVYNFGTESQEGAKAALRDCQDLFGCVSISHQTQIAEAFEMEHKIIKTIMRFIPSIKESVAEYEVVCCSGSRCAGNGSLEVLKAVKDTLDIDFNETTEDGKIRLSTQNCFKKCNLGPNIMVNGKFHHQMDRKKAKLLIEEIKK